jgi:hypothetical protein
MCEDVKLGYRRIGVAELRALSAEHAVAHVSCPKRRLHAYSEAKNVPTEWAGKISNPHRRKNQDLPYHLLTRPLLHRRSNSHAVVVTTN